MNSKERVQAMLRREPMDRVPIFMWFHPETARMLAHCLEIPLHLLDEALGNDVKQRWLGNNHAMEGVSLAPDETRRDEWGILWRREGEFNQIAESPLAGAAETEIAAYTFPAGIDALVENLNALRPFAGEFFIGADVSPCAFELYNRIRGMEEALLDIALYPETVRVFFDKSTRFTLELIDRACRTGLPDWIWLGDDVGGQRNLLFHPQSWRELVRPGLAELARRSHQYGMPVAYHSCGAIHAIIGDLIELGIDVLNPLQCSCPEMESVRLHREFGAELTFMGGVDTQRLLPCGEAAEVYDKTAELIDTMLADHGSYILAASHTVPPETPLDNIFAMYAAAGLTKEQILHNAEILRGREP